MFEFDERRIAAPGSAAPPPTIRAPQRVVLSWGEHCIECAAPACFATCDLFDATKHGRCRRFEDGIIARTLPDGRTAAEVKFKRWGKLEAQGSAALLPARQADRAERFAEAVSGLLEPLGNAASAMTGQGRWHKAPERFRRWAARRAGRDNRSQNVPDMVLFDVENLESEPVRLLFTATVDVKKLPRAVAADQLPQPFAVNIDLPRGFSSHSLDAAGMAPLLRSGLPFLLSLAPAGDSGAHLLIHRLDLARVARGDAGASKPAPAAPAKLAKLVIFDLDNTLWDGILLEGEVAERREVADVFRTLDERGILISVASKNARSDAIAKLESLGLDRYLLHPQIGWLPKSQAVAEIVRALNIGIDSAIFVDDNPFERSEVAETHPQVEVLPDTAIPSLADHPRLQGSVTPESRARREMYRQAVEREQAEESFGSDYLEFLRSCGIHVTIRPDRPDDVDRIAELVQRTNQLNFSGRKYGRAEIEAILRDPSRDRHVIIVSDKFGSYGTVGFCLSSLEERADGAELAIEDFMLSCRVQGKFIEQALIAELLRRAGRPVARVRVAFAKTDRNRAAQMVLEDMGFVAGQAGGYARAVPEDGFAVDFLTIDSVEPLAA